MGTTPRVNTIVVSLPFPTKSLICPFLFSILDHMASDDFALQQLVDSLKLMNIHEGTSTSTGQSFDNTNWKSSLVVKVLTSD